MANSLRVSTLSRSPVRKGERPARSINTKCSFFGMENPGWQFVLLVLSMMGVGEPIFRLREALFGIRPMKVMQTLA